MTRDAEAKTPSGSVVWPVSRANAEEIARSMLELGGMAGGAAELRAGLAQADEGLQAVGAAYAKRLNELQELRRTHANMAAARQVHTDVTKGWCERRRGGKIHRTRANVAAASQVSHRALQCMHEMC